MDNRSYIYSKDAWSLYFRGLKVENASVSSFIDQGDGYGKDNWNVFYCGQKIKDASASSFEYLGNDYGKNNWKVYFEGYVGSYRNPEGFN